MNIARPPGPRDRFFGLSLLRQMARDYLGFWRSAQQSFGDSLYVRVVEAWAPIPSWTRN
ncbi:hypothetical protein LP420_26915 [Massilia sp. B-10]|nr:hypothetical protein LP420_26915 [Massilia sp. B-10]